MSEIIAEPTRRAAAQVVGMLAGGTVIALVAISFLALAPLWADHGSTLSASAVGSNWADHGSSAKAPTTATHESLT